MYQTEHIEDILESMQNIDVLPERLVINDNDYWLNIYKINGKWHVRYATEHGNGAGLLLPVAVSANFFAAVDNLVAELKAQGYEI